MGRSDASAFTTHLFVTGVLFAAKRQRLAHGAFSHSVKTDEVDGSINRFLYRLVAASAFHGLLSCLVHGVAPVVFPMHPSPGASVKNSVLLSAPCAAPRFPHLAGVTHFVFGVIRRLACVVWRPPIRGVRQVPEPAWRSKFLFRAVPVAGDRSAKIPDC